MSTSYPHEQMAHLLTGYWVSQALYAAAKLGLADLLKDGPRPVEELAHAAQVRPDALYRLLRALASVGVFSEDQTHRFALTPLAECLRRDVPGSQWAMAVMNGEEHYQSWGGLLHSLRTGQPAFEKLYGMGVFEYLTQHPESARVFDQAMVSVHGRETATMLDAYDFAGIGVLADVGGGNGSLLTAVLKKHPSLRGILFDLPGVIERARANVDAAGVADRCQLLAGSFFESIPPGADAVLMRHIIHDWDDERSLQILRNVHRALKTGGKLLLVEGVIQPGNEPSFGKLLDLTMLVIPGGQERTEEEYRRLYTAGGFRLTRVVPTKGEISVIEGEKV